MVRQGTTFATWALVASGAWAHISIPAVDGSLPEAGSNGCAAGYWPANHTLSYTVPYSYDQVLSLIGNYTNLTWSGSPANSVQTNNTDALDTNDWTPGSARFYDFGGAHFIETLTQYQRPNNGPYVQVHTVAPLQVPSYSNVKLYSEYDAQHWLPVCDGRATAANFTVNYCATNVDAADAFFEKMHTMAAARVGQLLGAQEFTNCEALGVRSYLRRAVSSISGSMSTGTVIPNTVIPNTVNTVIPATTSSVVNTVVPATTSSTVNTVISATKTSTVNTVLPATTKTSTSTLSASGGSNATASGSPISSSVKATYTGAAATPAIQIGGVMAAAVVALVAGGLAF